MRLYTILNLSCTAVSVACMSFAYALAGYWLGLPVFLVLTLFWMLQKKQQTFWPASSFLLIYVLLAVIGTVLHLPVVLLVAGCTAALICWDLTIFQMSQFSTRSLENQQTLAQHHLRSLMMAVSLGLVLSFIASYINIRLPFLAVALLALIAIGCLTYGLQSLIRKSR